jgi:hypothetical protein
MLPFSRLVMYGIPPEPIYKIDHNFDTNTSRGSLTSVLSGASYGAIPAVPTNTYGYTRGVTAGSLAVTGGFNIGSSDCLIECTFYVNSNSSTLNQGFLSFGGPYPSTSFTGMQYGDSGQGYRLSAFLGLGATADKVHCLARTANTDFQKVLKFKLERKLGVERLYLNGIQQNFAQGGSTTFISSIANTASIANQTTVSVGGANLYLARLIIHF